MLKLSDFSYHLPPGRIAQDPMQPRDHSRLLVLDRATGNIRHHRFYELPTLLSEKDVLVRNDTKVIPARIFGQKNTGGAVELLLIKRVAVQAQNESWECLTKPGLKPGQVLYFPKTTLTAVCQEITGFSRLLKFSQAGSQLFSTLFEIGHTPLPPYLDWERHDEAELRQLYQTTYAKIQGSAAAPTAGLHFTPEVDATLKERGIEIIEVTLHVGLGTFLRVKTEDITQHQMHSEYFELSPIAAERLNQAKAAGGNIISVGTTTTRVLESCATAPGQVIARRGETRIFIYPPYRFQFVDSLITNFHEPNSTLLMLVSAFTTSPNTSHDFTTFAETPVGHAYQAALNQQYRFLSFGDSMMIR